MPHPASRPEQSSSRRKDTPDKKKPGKRKHEHDAKDQDRKQEPKPKEVVKGSMGPPAKKFKTASEAEEQRRRGEELLKKLEGNRVLGREEDGQEHEQEHLAATRSIGHAEPIESMSIPIASNPLHEALPKTHTLTTINIISSSSIRKKATRALEILNTYPVDQSKGEKDNIVILCAKAKVAGKMISVVEIVKREVGAKGGKWFQYNAVGEVKEVVSSAKKDGGKNSNLNPNPKSKTRGNPKSGSGSGVEEGDADRDGRRGEQMDVVVEGAAEEDDEEESFEVMKTPFERAIEGKPKIRAVPTMTVYLSRVRIESLRNAYSEETNGLEKKT